MKTAKILILLTLGVALSACAVKPVDDGHHFDGTYQYDNINHWQACTDFGCIYIKNKANHDLETIREVAPTCSSDGIVEKKCKTCDYHIYETKNKLNHTAADYSYDSEYHWHVCDRCQEKFGIQAHSLSDWIVEKEATLDQDGYRYKICSVCNKKAVEEVTPAQSHIYNPSVWNYDTNNHWHDCSHCSDHILEAPHSFDNGVVTKEATCTEKGIKTYTCKTCNYKKTEEIELKEHTYSTTWSSNGSYHWHECTVCKQQKDKSPHVSGPWIVDCPATKTSEGSKHKECTECGVTTEIATIPYEESSTINIYAINDFHGEVDRISKTMGYLKARKNEGNTILLNSGDSYQGSMISNGNYGQLLTKCMNQVGFDEITVGNHDFDWGLDKLDDIIDTASMPFLGANVYHYNFDTHTFGTFATEYFQKYTVKTLDNGIKVGIIGVIGEDQITSICTQFVKTVGFKTPVPIVKELATELRNTQGCDVVLLSAHCDASQLFGGSSGATVTDTQHLEDYVDAVFLGHTHSPSVKTYGGIPYIQGSPYGAAVSNVQLSIDADTKDVTVNVSKNITYSSSWPSDSISDSLIAAERAIREEEGNEVLATYVPYLSAASGANLVTHAMAEIAIEQGYNIDLALTNTARSSFSGGTLTYEELYNVVPFDNIVYIAQVRGSDLLSEINYGNYIYRINPNAFSSSGTYTVAVIDYLLLHCNASRYYNYFRNFTILGQLESEYYDLYNYRYITRDFLRNSTPEFTDYTLTNNRNDGSKITQAVTF